MTDLAYFLKNIPDDRPLVIMDDKAVKRGALASETSAASCFSGIKVALCLSDIVQAIKMLIAFDGVADQILLLSVARSTSENAALTKKAGCHVLLVDRPEDYAVSSMSLPAFRTIEELKASGIFSPRPKEVLETRWVLSTSGTTGTPKLVSHTLRSLTRTSKTTHDNTKHHRWAMVYDYTRFAGLQVVLQSLLSGALLVAPDFGMPLEDKIVAFIHHKCTHMSATPTLWRKLSMTPSAKQLPLNQVTLGGEIADDLILQTLKNLYPNARITHIFASTEAGVGFSVSDGRAGFPEEFLVTPPNGVDIRVVDGRLFVRNSSVNPAYLGDEKTFVAMDGFVDTGDSVEIKNGRVLFLGRASGVINIGGDKVHPEEIEHVLLEHPFISAARVYGKSNPFTGSVVVADIGLADPDIDPAEARESILTYASARLDRHKVPALLKIISEFEINAAGKLTRAKS